MGAAMHMLEAPPAFMCCLLELGCTIFVDLIEFNQVNRTNADGGAGGPGPGPGQNGIVITVGGLVIIGQYAYRLIDFVRYQYGRAGILTGSLLHRPTSYSSPFVIFSLFHNPNSILFHQNP